MKRVLSLAGLLILAFAFLVRAQDINLHIDAFGGLNNYYETSKIPDTDAIEARNVLTDRGFLEKRTGNIRATQILDGFPNKNEWEFITPSNNTRYLITHTSDSIFQTSFAGAPAIVSSVAANTNVDGVSAFSRFYWVNRTDPMKSWDGTSVVATAGAPKCSYIEFKDERLWCANTSDNNSKISVSSFGADNSWTVPAVQDGDDPDEFLIQDRDGYAITCLKVTPWGVVAGKANSMHVIKGNDNITYYKQIISPTVGCIDDRSMRMRKGKLIWLSLDGIYSWDGSNPPVLESQDIDTTVKAIRQRFSYNGRKTFTTAADWQSGTQPSLNAPGVSSAESSRTAFRTDDILGSLTVRKNMGPLFDNTDAQFAAGTITVITDPTLSSNSVNGAIPSGMLGIRVATVSFVNAGIERMGSGEVLINVATSNWNNETLGQFFIATATPVGFTQFGNRSLFMNCLTGANSVSFTIQNPNAANGTLFQSEVLDSVGSREYWIDLSTYPSLLRIRVTDEASSVVSNNFSKRSGSWMGFRIAVTAGGCSAGERGYFDMAESSSSDTGLVYASTGTFLSRIFDTSISTPVWGPLEASVLSSSYGSVAFRTQTSSDATTWSTLALISTGARVTSPSRRYWRYQADLTSTDGTGSPLLEATTAYYVSTGTYTSPVLLISNSINTWQTINFTQETDGSASLSYQVRSGSNSFAADASTATTTDWTAQTNNQNVAVSTNAYIQFRITDVLTSSTETATVHEVNVEWLDGDAKPVASAVLDDRYFLSVTTTAGTQNNDVVLVLQKNNKWTTFNGPSYASLTLWDNKIYAGDGNTGSYIWKILQDGIYQDDGAAISARWVSKDFTAGEPVKFKSLSDMWVEANVSSASLTVGFSANKNPTLTTKEVNLNVSSYVTNARVPAVDGFALGKYLRFGFENVDLDEYIRVHSYTAFYTLQPYRLDDSTSP